MNILQREIKNDKIFLNSYLLASLAFCSCVINGIIKPFKEKNEKLILWLVLLTRKNVKTEQRSIDWLENQDMELNWWNYNRESVGGRSYVGLK